MSRSTAGSNKRRSSRNKFIDDEDGGDDNEEEEEDEMTARSRNNLQRRRVSDESSSSSNGKGRSAVKSGDLHFTQQAPELSQQPIAPKAFELTRLTQLNEDLQDRIVTDLARMLLFKGLSGEPIDRLKVIKEALGDHFDSQRSNVANAALARASERLGQTFGFQLSRAPKIMEDDKFLPCSKTKIKDRLYLINSVKDDEVGSHAKALQSVHIESAVEKGLLMLILALIYCKGEVKEGKTRWIKAETLYKLLHSIDEQIPAEPSSTRATASSSSWETTTDFLLTAHATPNVDAMLQKFVYLDYLLKVKNDESTSMTMTANTQSNDDSVQVSYAMGPRSALEVGRKQVLFFCSEILDEQPDPTMLAELEDQDEEEENKAED